MKTNTTTGIVFSPFKTDIAGTITYKIEVVYCFELFRNKLACAAVQNDKQNIAL